MDYEDKDKIISELQEELRLSKYRNEYNQNLYEMQYKTLKESFLRRMRKDLGLEIEDLMDISDSLNEVQAGKIKCVIRNMTKIIQKEI